MSGAHLFGFLPLPVVAACQSFCCGPGGHGPECGRPCGRCCCPNGWKPCAPCGCRNNVLCSHVAIVLIQDTVKEGRYFVMIKVSGRNCAVVCVLGFFEVQRSAGRELASSRLRYQVVKLVVILASILKYTLTSPVEAADQLLSFGSSFWHTSSHVRYPSRHTRKSRAGAKKGMMNTEGVRSNGDQLSCNILSVNEYTCKVLSTEYS